MKKILFIFSNDFGELVLLRLFSFGQPMHIHVALPHRLYNHFDLPNVTKILYKNTNEIKTYVEKIEPDTVVLYCGYLIAPNNIIPYSDFHALLDYFNQRDIPIITSDPFLRFYEHNNYEAEGNEFRPYIRNALKRLGERLADYPHIYCVPFQSRTVQTINYSNQLKRDNNIYHLKRKEWTFVLAWEDFAAFRFDDGHDLLSIICPQLEEITRQHNITVNLIFPSDFINEIKKLIPNSKNIHYIEFCNIEKFESIIARSEIIFYWNLFSASTLLCRLYNKPTIYLAKGHMELIYPGFFEYASRSWFPENPPEIIPLTKDFVSVVLSKLNSSSQNDKAAIFQPYYNLLSPVEALSKMG